MGNDRSTDSDELDERTLDDGEERSVDARRSRSAVADTLRSLADQLEREPALKLRFADESVAVGVGDPVRIDLELERDDDEVELDLELEWTEPDRLDGAARELSPVQIDRETHREGGGAIGSSEDGAAIDGVGGHDGSASAVESLATFQLFEDRADEWRWRLVHQNGNIIATSGEGYTSKQNARKGIRSVLSNVPSADVVESDK